MMNRESMLTFRNGLQFLICWMVILAAIANPAHAADADWKIGIRVINSDNLSRLSAGLEDVGTQFTVLSGLDLKWEQADTSYSIGGEVGSERLVSNRYAHSQNLIYLLNTDFQFFRKSNRYITVSAEASRDTSIPEADLIDRSRVLEDRLTASVLTGGKSSTSSWEVGYTREDIERESAESRSNKINFQKKWNSGPVGELTFSGSALRGDNVETATIWKEGELSAEFVQNLTGRTLRGESLSWSATKTSEKGTSTISRTSNFSLLFFRESEITPLSQFGVSIGADGVKTEGEEREWAGQASLTLDSDITNRLIFNLESSVSTQVFRDEQRIPAWSRTAQLSLGLTYNVFRSWESFSNVTYGKDNFPKGTAGMPSGLKRRDERFYGQLGLRRQPSEDYELSASMIVEKVNSTLWTADFEEHRMQLAATLMF